MNILTIIFVLVFFLLGSRGYKKGFTREIRRLITLVITFAVMLILILFGAAVVEESGRIMAVAAALLILTGLAYRLIKILLRSLYIVSGLPILNIGNRLLGAATGCMEALVIFWIMYLVIEKFPMGGFGQQVMEWTRESVVLTNVYRKNFIMNFILGIAYEL